MTPVSEIPGIEMHDHPVGLADDVAGGVFAPGRVLDFAAVGVERPEEFLVGVTAGVPMVQHRPRRDAAFDIVVGFGITAEMPDLDGVRINPGFPR